MRKRKLNLALLLLGAFFLAWQKTLPAGLARLIALSQAVPEKTDAARKELSPSWLERVGESGLAAWTGGRAMLSFLGESVVTCEPGPRAWMAAQALRLHGFRNVTLLEGRMLGWRRGNNPVEQ